MILAAMALADPIPNYYDIRGLYPKCFFSVSDQGTCWSTWAQSIAGLMSNKLCMTGTNVTLSPQQLLSCANPTCDLNNTVDVINKAFTYAQTPGLPTSDCVPYNTSFTCATNNSCINKAITYKAYTCSAVKTISGFDNIKNEIMTNGPVICTLQATKDFKDYYDGIYFSVHTKRINNLAFKVLGWGIENGLKYWTVETGMGINKGENGFARIALGFCNVTQTCTPNKQ